MVMAPSAIAIDDKETTILNDSKVDFIDHNHGVESDVTGFASKALIQKVLKEQIARVNVDTCEPGEEDAFYVADLGEVYRQHLRWKLNLARVKPFYAVKCNPDPEVLRLLAKMGTGFDCASRAEIDLVLGLGIAPSRIIYAQPCKTKSYLRHARKLGVTQMTFDNSDELRKIKECFPEAELVLRILTDDSASLCRFSAKYGASLEDAAELLQLARDLDLNIVGVSFHVGSGASDPGSFGKAVKDARHVFNQAAELGYDLKMLDVGGGFVDETFELFAANLNEALEEHFPHNVSIIAEPGRYYVATAFTLATHVIARREVSVDGEGGKGYMLYLNDGVYGNFSNIIFDHQHPVPQILSAAAGGDKMTEYSIWGPTCDGIDVIADRYFLPGVVDIGDWLFFENMGAYTKCSATRFNGFKDDHEVIYISSEPGASALLGY
ncbi:ornithine decarboxylase [Exophiala dermatitidis NIH/UT8656]|uniref:Ornithine decarboxylase n=1 Tax=Exophiala dermatitidis (strain ATCC 34100 / CBS 525.76 / NIH/UT8656) TaxID=858893 RepID=H6BK01_EXODN|nr:ornithine decarboxylase [Exophiala dermatitidis NIH/UT8656]EHY52455.1 ornithine decarboxylase [Exophiala dermatitidis NIH/UT8656]